MLVGSSLRATILGQLYTLLEWLTDNSFFHTMYIMRQKKQKDINAKIFFQWLQTVNRNAFSVTGIFFPQIYKAVLKTDF